MTTRSIPNLAGGREPASAVVLVDPATGLPYAATGGAGLTDAQLRAAAVPVSGPVTDTQLRAAPVPVLAQTRTCLGVAQIVGLSTTVAASLPGIPANALTAEIQADGGSIRVRRDGTAPTSTLGWRIDDGVDKTVDSALGSVRLLAVGSGTNVQIAYFDRV